MHRALAVRLSPAMAVALLALFVSLGGSAYAAFTLPTGSVGTAQLRHGAVTNGKLHRGSVGQAKIKNGAVTNIKLANPTVRIESGRGLTGGGPVALGGSARLVVNPAVIQNRVAGTCASGEAISAVAEGGGVDCQPAGARDIGAVTPGSTPSFRSEELRGWRSITNQGTGEYCLIPDSSTTTSNAVVLVSLGNEGGGSPAGGSASVTGVCNASGDTGFSIETWVDGSPSNEVPFTAVIP